MAHPQAGQGWSRRRIGKDACVNASHLLPVSLIDHAIRRRGKASHDPRESARRHSTASLLGRIDHVASPETNVVASSLVAWVARSALSALLRSLTSLLVESTSLSDHAPK